MISIVTKRLIYSAFSAPVYPRTAYPDKPLIPTAKAVRIWTNKKDRSIGILPNMVKVKATNRFLVATLKIHQVWITPRSKF